MAPRRMLNLPAAIQPEVTPAGPEPGTAYWPPRKHWSAAPFRPQQRLVTMARLALIVGEAVSLDFKHSALATQLGGGAA